MTAAYRAMAAVKCNRPDDCRHRMPVNGPRKGAGASQTPILYPDHQNGTQRASAGLLGGVIARRPEIGYEMLARVTR